MTQQRQYNLIVTKRAIHGKESKRYITSNDTITQFYNCESSSVRELRGLRFSSVLLLDMYPEELKMDYPEVYEALLACTASKATKIISIVGNSAEGDF